MALLCNYTLPGTNYTIENAYWVVGIVTVKKIVNQTTLVDKDGTETSQPDHYRGTIVLNIWSSKESREKQEEPVGRTESSLLELPVFEVDPNNNLFQQAYDFLKAQEMFSEAKTD